MLTRPLFLLAVAGVFAAFAPFAAAQSSGKPTGRPAGEPVESHQVRAWLLRIHQAASHRNFQGTFVVSSAGAVSSARIAHYCEGSSQYERIESLDGPARQVFRHNEVVHTVWPRLRMMLVEQRDALTSFPALLQGGDDHIADHYELRTREDERIAGHAANVLQLSPRDNKRYGYKLWADQASGLLLRADVLGEQNQVIETSAFSDVTIGVRPQPETVLQAMKRVDGYRIVHANLKPTRLDAEGWTQRQTVAGFREVSCVRRPMNLPRDDGAQGSATEALQTIYSDGLTYVSVFIEPADAAHPRKPGASAMGATQTLTVHKGDHWVTVVGDVPAATLSQFAEGLERKK